MPAPASLLELNASPSLSTQSGGYNPTSGRLEINTCAVDEAVKTASVEGAAKIGEREGSPDAGTAGGAVPPLAMLAASANQSARLCAIDAVAASRRPERLPVWKQTL